MSTYKRFIHCGLHQVLIFLTRVQPIQASDYSAFKNIFCSKSILQVAKVILFCFHFLFALLLSAHEFQLNGLKIQTDRFQATPQDIVDFNENVLTQSKIKYETDDRSTRDRELFENLQLYLRHINPELQKKLDEAEIAAIQAYTNDHYYDRINRVFDGRSDLKANPDIAALIKLLISGLNRLPSYSQGVVYRGVGWWETAIDEEKYLKDYKSYYDKLEKNGEMTFAFMSTTKDIETKFVRCTPFIFRVTQSQNGKDISDISVKPDEKEILFKPFTKFVIKNKFTRKLENKELCQKQLDFDQQLVVDLEEISP